MACLIPGFLQNCLERGRTQSDYEAPTPSTLAKPIVKWVNNTDSTVLKVAKIALVVLAFFGSAFMTFAGFGGSFTGVGIGVGAGGAVLTALFGHVLYSLAKHSDYEEEVEISSARGSSIYSDRSEESDEEELRIDEGRTKSHPNAQKNAYNDSYAESMPSNELYDSEAD